MNASEASIAYESYEKFVFCAKKLLFQPYFLNCKMKKSFLSNLNPFCYVVIYLVKSLKLEKSGLKIHYHFLQFTKKAEKAILWSRICSFGKFVIFAGKLLSFKMLHLANPKHVGTPCTLYGNFLTKEKTGRKQSSTSLLCSPP